MSSADIEAIRRKLKRPFPMRGLECRLFAAVSLVLVFGIAWSVLLHDWQWFERSGALVILVAVGLGWKDHVSLLGKIENLYLGQFDKLLAEVDAAQPTGLIATAMQDGQREEVRNLRMTTAELITGLRKRVRTTEVAILCLGTVVWGYGSPAGNLFWSFG